MGELIATRQAYGKEIIEMAKVHPDMVVMDADLSKSTLTLEFSKAFPERFVQMGIAEQDMMATAAGMATMGKKVFASTFAIFAAGRAYDQVRNSITYNGLDVKICATHAGLTVGEDGASHQMIEDLALMRVLPNMTVLCPSDANSAKWALNAAYEHHGPVYIRLGRVAVPEYHELTEGFKIGKAVRMKRGKDVSIMACGMLIGPALEAVELLKAEGISAGLLDMITIKPIDVAAVLEDAANCGAIVTAEEHNIIGGLGGAVAETVTSAYPVPVVRVGVKDTFGESGKPEQLLKKYGLGAIDIVEAAKKAIGLKSAAGLARR